MRVPAIRAISVALATLLFVPSAALGGHLEPATSRGSSDATASISRSSVDAMRSQSSASEDLPVVAEDELIVVFDRAADSSIRVAAHKAAGTKVLKRTRTAGAEAQLVKLSRGSDKSRVARAYRSMPGVDYVQSNFLYRPAAITPNDTYFSSQWPLKNVGGTDAKVDGDIDADDAWVDETGSEDVVVAVTDTGVAYNHIDLAPNIWTNPGEIAGNHVDDDHNGYVDDVHGWDFVGRDADPSDFKGHGTHVAGIIGAQGNNAEGIAGVAWDVKLMPLKVMNDNGVGDSIDAIEAIEYAVANGADVINASWGVALTSTQLDGVDQLLRETIEASGLLFVAAAGNSNSSNDGASRFYPASFPSANIISVAATNKLDVVDSAYHTGYSNYGATTVDLAAPGTSVLSASNEFYLLDDGFDTHDNWDVASLITQWGDTFTFDDGPDGVAVLEDYGDNERATLTLKEPLNLSAPGKYELAFWYYVNSEPVFDVLKCEVSTDGVTWTSIADMSGLNTQDYKTVSLTSYAGEPVLHVRFSFTTNEAYGPDNEYRPVAMVDYFSVVRLDGTSGNAYRYMDGTSMAAPHVTGAAALALSVNPQLNATSLKSLLMDNVDIIGTPGVKTVTGGRLNAQNVVAAAPTAPLVAGVNRLAARDRFATALAIAKRAHPGWVGVTDIVIASGEDRSAADPLAAAGLVWAYDGAPLMLVSSSSVPWSVQDELEEIAEMAAGPIRLHVVGGTSAIPAARVQEIEDLLERNGVATTSDRIGGANRYDTARKIAQKMVSERGAELSGDVLIANGANPASFYDALALSPIAAKRGAPILLVSQSSIPAETSAMLATLSPDRVVVGGGVNTVSETVEAQLGVGRPVERWSGRNRYETATTIAENAVTEGLLSPQKVCVAGSLADALSSASISGVTGGPLLLTSKLSLATATGTWFSSHAGEVSQVWVLGGTNSVPSAQDTAIAGLLN